MKTTNPVPPHSVRDEAKRKTRIMYMENKSEQGLNGCGRIGLVSFSKTGKTIYYKDHAFQTLSGFGFKANYFDIKTGDYWWISGPHKDGEDRLYAGQGGVEIDEDVQEEYWRDIRGKNKEVHSK